MLTKIYWSFGIVAAAIVMFLAGLAIGRRPVYPPSAQFVGTATGTVADARDGAPTTIMPSGQYLVYSIQKMFDTQTGEPTYWMIAESVHEISLAGTTYQVHTGDIKFYIVPRKALMYPQPDSKPDRNLNPYNLDMMEEKSGDLALR